MHIVLGFVLFVILIVISVYGSASEKTLSSPLLLLVLGVIVCVLASACYVVVDVLKFLLANEGSAPYYDWGKSLVGMILASLGGGIISSAYAQRAKLLHEQGIDGLADKILHKKEYARRLENDLADMGSSEHVSAAEASRQQNVISRKAFLELEIQDIEAKIERRKKAR